MYLRKVFDARQKADQVLLLETLTCYSLGKNIRRVREAGAR